MTKRKKNPRRPARRWKNDAPKTKIEYPTEITYYEGITVGQLADLLKRQASEIIKTLFMLGNMVTINSALDNDTVELIAMEYNVTATKKEFVEEDSLVDDIVDDPKDLKERPPIVTIMGHVDHGKTTLLDTIRKTDVVESEAGGITQHIGAYQVTVKGKKITFLDTPGHEAFTSMRARGSKVTDIVVIVVAADDGVMPQTKEAIDHAKAAECPIIVAINKIDKPDKNIERIKNQLADNGVMPEEWGGDTIFVEVSAKQNTGIDKLLETIQVLAEVMDLKANPKRLGVGSVIEAKLDKGRGPVATVLVENGVLKTGDPVVVGSCFGKVRKMTDDKGKEIKQALPATPVEIIGLNNVPIAGDNFKVFKEEKEARQVAERRLQVQVDTERRSTSALSLDDLSRQISEGEVQEIPVVLKTDVQGSAEAVKAALERIDVEGIKVNVIRATPGAISESDIMLANASKAIVYGFNVRPSALVRRKAEEENVEIRLHRIIYKLTEEMEAAMKGMLAPVYEEVIFGQAEVRQTFKASKVGTIAGCYVTDGKIVKDSKVRLIRDGIEIYDGQMASLKRFQNDAKEVTSGYECGITIERYNDLKEGDIIESYGDQEVPVV